MRARTPGRYRGQRSVKEFIAFMKQHATSAQGQRAAVASYPQDHHRGAPHLGGQRSTDLRGLYSPSCFNLCDNVCSSYFGTGGWRSGIARFAVSVGVRMISRRYPIDENWRPEKVEETSEDDDISALDL